MKYLLDSDILISYFKKKPQIVSPINNWLKTTHLAISVITVTEIRSGWTDQMALNYMKKVYDIFEIHETTKRIAEQAGIWRYHYKTKGIQLTTTDSIIAATAYLHNFTLITNNIKDYPMPELKLYKP